VGPRAGLDGCRKSRPPTGNRSLDRPARSDSTGTIVSYINLVIAFTKDVNLVSGLRTSLCLIMFSGLWIINSDIHY